MKKYLLGGFAVLSILGASTHAEDIEIFQPSLLDDIEDTDPNILFIMDTSGSMRRSTAVMFGNYDPNIDYDPNSPDDDLIYVFNSSFTPQNITFERDQVACEALLNAIDNNPTFPVFPDRAVQWSVEPNGGPDVDCPLEEVSDETTVNAVIGNSAENLFEFTIPIADLVPDSFIEVIIENFSEAQGANAGEANSVTVDLGYYWLNADGNVRTQFLCTASSVGAGDIGGCLNSEDNELQRSAIPDTQDGFDVLGAIVRAQTGMAPPPPGSDPEDEADTGISDVELMATISAEVRYNVRTQQEDLACIPGPQPDTGNWRLDGLFQPDDDNEVVECESDAGIHGISNTTVETYATVCPDGSCTEPNYTTSQLAGIDFQANDIDTYNFVSRNFRDYLLDPIPDNATISATVGNPEAYCAGATNRNGQFVERTSDGVIFQCIARSIIMQDAARALATTLEDVNIGLMRFEQNGEGGAVILDIGSVSDENGEQHRQDFIDTIGELEFQGTTPLAESLHEAHRYFSGQQEDFSRPAQFSGPPSRDLDAFLPGTLIYDSPIEHACQSNNIVLLTDGQPIGDNNESRMEALVRDLAASIDNPPLADTNCNDNGSGTADNCLDELAAAMARYDHSGVIDGENTVNLFTVGFTIDLPLLDNAAELGGGDYFLADDFLQLQAAFQQIIIQIEDAAPTSLVAPAVSVNAFNELQHRDDLYYAVFEPNSSPRWQGNVKRYRLEDGNIVDSNDALAIDPATGFFVESSQSVWSDEADGPDVPIGGIREQLTQDRNIFVDGDVLAAPQTGIVPLNNGTQFSPAAAGVASAAQALRVRDWLLGRDVDDEDGDGDVGEANRYAAHSLHSQPFVVTYEGSTVDDARDVLFVPTNQGLLHAIDARPNSGEEMWAYLPGSQTGNIAEYLNNDLNSNHVYGLDGESTIFIEEDFDSDNFEVETVHIYQGMRRGGRNYYGWDVSNALSTTQTPIETLWEIEGGQGGFDQLGQSWSAMLSASVLYGCDEDGDGCTERDVLIFSGGYDTFYDDEAAVPHTGSSNVLGNAIYMIDRETGQLLWSAGDGADGHDLDLDMFNSIPATPTLIDNDADGNTDILFAVDIAGNVFRVDFDEMAASPTDPDFSQGGTIAELGDGQPRRFYNQLDVSFSAPQGEVPFLNITVGSGYRAHPRDENEGQNAIFVVHDDFVFAPQDENEDGVYEYDYHPDGVVSFAAGHLFQTNEGTPADRNINAEFGFYIPLDFPSEKILQRTTTFNGAIIVASYVPNNGENIVSDVCGLGSIGGGRIYAFDLATGATIFEDELVSDGIPPEATILFTGTINQTTGGPEDEIGGPPTVCIGTECFQPEDVLSGCNRTNPSDISQTLCANQGRAIRTFWREEE